MMFTATGMIIMGLALFTPPILCHIIARIENRNSIRWFLYGLFFGVFAVIYLVFYVRENAEDRIEFRVMVLLIIFWSVGLLGLYHTFIGFYF